MNILLSGSSIKVLSDGVLRYVDLVELITNHHGVDMIEAKCIDMSSCDNKRHYVDRIVVVKLDILPSDDSIFKLMGKNVLLHNASEPVAIKGIKSSACQKYAYSV